MFNDLEIRILICERDVQMAINMVKSLRKYDKFKNTPIYFHDDGSLNEESKNVILEISESYIVDKTYADSIILELLDKYPNCKRYRFDDVRIFNNTKMKLFDFYFLSKSKNILFIDSDILFLNEPKNIIDLVDKSSPFYFPDFQNSYSFCKSTKTNILENVNVGIVYIPTKNHYNINEIEFALNDLFTIGFTNRDWIEQSAWSYMFHKDGRYVKLNDTKNQIPRPNHYVSESIESLHFVGHPPIRGLYGQFLKKLRFL